MTIGPALARSVESSDAEGALFRRIPLLALHAGAVALALAAQLAVSVAPRSSLVGFAAAAVLVIVAERRRPPPAEPMMTSPAPVSLACRRTLTAGLAVCTVAGLSVVAGGGPRLNHLVWALGLVLLGTSAVLASLRTDDAWHFSRRTTAALVVVGLVAAPLFLWDVSAMPPEVHGDEGEVGADALRLLDEKFDLFTTGWGGHPMFHAFPMAVGLKIAGVNLSGLRGASAILGVLAVLLVFEVGRRLWSLEVGVLSALFLASARYFIHLSRTGYNYVETPLISILAVCLFLRLWYDGRLAAAIWCGIVLGLGTQTYLASRLVPVLLTATLLLWLVGCDRHLAAARLRHFGIVVLTATATAAPMIGHFTHDWDALMARTRGVNVFSTESLRHLSQGYHTNDVSQILLIQLKRTLTLFNVTGDTSLQYGYRASGLLEPLSAAFFVLGVGVLVARPLLRRNQLVFLWLAAPTIAGSALMIDAPSYVHISGIMPFVALTVAVGVHGFLGSIREAFLVPAARVAAGAVGVVILGVAFSLNLWTYFVEYAPQHRHSAAVDISSFVRMYGRDKTTYMVGGAPTFFIKHGTIRFLTYGYDTRDIYDLEDYLRQNSLDPGRSLFVVMAHGQEKALLARLEQLVGPLDVRSYHDTRDAIQFYGVAPKPRGRT
jgi:4-amino-4-deoxy-L-arabinose transferase-like glycosyltransferase